MSRLQGKIAIVFGAGWAPDGATERLQLSSSRGTAHVVCVDVNRDAAEETAGITSPASVFRSDGGLTCRAA